MLIIMLETSAFVLLCGCLKLAYQTSRPSDQCPDEHPILDAPDALTLSILMLSARMVVALTLNALMVVALTLNALMIMVY